MKESYKLVDSRCTFSHLSIGCPLVGCSSQWAGRSGQTHAVPSAFLSLRLKAKKAFRVDGGRCSHFSCVVQADLAVDLGVSPVYGVGLDFGRGGGLWWEPYVDPI